MAEHRLSDPAYDRQSAFIAGELSEIKRFLGITETIRVELEKVKQNIQMLTGEGEGDASL